jgi:hypothetical protein
MLRVARISWSVCCLAKKGRPCRCLKLLVSFHHDRLGHVGELRWFFCIEYISASIVSIGRFGNLYTGLDNLHSTIFYVGSAELNIM